MEDVALSRNFTRMEQDDEEGTLLPEELKLGVICSTNIQVAINEGNRQGHAFFVIRIGKAGIAMPFQQPIPLDFARYHPKLHLEDITLEGPCGRSWGVIIRPLCNVVRFGKGWRQFAVENNLREGNQLLFNLVGKSRFVVKFFDNLGKSHASFPPLTPAAAGAFVEPYSPPRRDEEDASEPPPFETPVAKPATPQARPTALDSDKAKVILRQFFTQVRPNPSTEVPNSKATVPNEDRAEHIVHASGVLNDVDGMETEHVGNQGSYEEQATDEGKAYIFLDSDDDDELVYRHEFPEKQGLPALFVRTPSKRDVFEGMGSKGGESSLREQTGFHSPEKVHTPRLAKNIIHLMPEERVKYVQQDDLEIHQDVEEDDHFTTSKTWSDDSPLEYLERQRPVRKKVSVRRASWEGKGGNAVATFAKSDGHRGSIRDVLEEKSATRNGYRKEVRDTSTRRAVQRANAVEDHSMATLSPAKLLLTQQGCMNYSEVISKCKRRRVTDEERNRALSAAKQCASALKNDNFLVVMRDAQVYHGFQLPIPRDFLEVTGTLQADKVKACLIDEQKTFYNAKWKWHANCQTPLLNSDGWAMFALDHMLEEGDVCVFELVGPGPAFLLSVRIFKVVETSVKDNCIREPRGGQSPLKKKFGMKAPAATNADRELRQGRGKKRPIIELGPPSVQRTVQKPYNLQAWTKLFKPRMVKAHFGGSRGQRQF